MNEIINNITVFFNENIKLIDILFGLGIFIILLILKNKISYAILILFSKIIIRKEPSKREPFIKSLQKPLSAFILTLGAFIGIYLNFRFKGVVHSFKIITILLMCWGMINYLSDNLIIALHFDKNDNTNKTAVRFISNLLKFIIIAFAIVMIISELGYNINGLIAGLGVGGLAVSLAAQDAVSNLISGFIIVTEKPFEEGDFIQTNGIQGTVMEVLMRSTKIKTIDDSIITLPNSSLANDSIINLSKIEKRLINLDFSLSYSTSNKLLKKCQDDIKDYLLNNEKILRYPLRVELDKLDESALILNLFCYTSENDINKFKAVLSDINYNVKEIIESNGAEFAFPSTSVYIEKQ